LKWLQKNLSFPEPDYFVRNACTTDCTKLRESPTSFTFYASFMSLKILSFSSICPPFKELRENSEARISLYSHVIYVRLGGWHFSVFFSSLGHRNQNISRSCTSWCLEHEGRNFSGSFFHLAYSAWNNFPSPTPCIAWRNSASSIALELQISPHHSLSIIIVIRIRVFPTFFPSTRLKVLQLLYSAWFWIMKDGHIFIRPRKTDFCYKRRFFTLYYKNRMRKLVKLS